jgi:hypothetical protein
VQQSRVQSAQTGERRQPADVITSTAACHNKKRRVLWCCVQRAGKGICDSSSSQTNTSDLTPVHVGLFTRPGEAGGGGAWPRLRSYAIGRPLAKLA